ncbi:cell surface protein SprA [Bacteroidota bacterium]
MLVFSLIPGFLSGIMGQGTSIDLQYPFREDPDAAFSDAGQISPLYLSNPSIIESEIVYDPKTNSYVFSEKIGDINYRHAKIMSFDEYRAYEMSQAKNRYWEQRRSGENLETQASFIPSINVGGEAFDRVFGTNTINIIPQGYAELIFGFNMSRIDNPTLTEKLRKTPSFTFEEKIQMNVTGTIGDKMKLGVNYNTEATFEFENKTKLEYTGKEDEIIKKIEAGDVTLPLSGSLIQGSQSLFGLKTELQFGKLTMTSVFSQQKGETSVIDVQGGAQISEYEINVDEYDANRHFFLSHYFKDNYDRALVNLPVINTGINITKLEIWVTNKTSNFVDSRNILALMDLSESRVNIFGTDYWSQASGQVGDHPRNELNTQYGEMTSIYAEVRDINRITGVLSPLLPGFSPGQDYEKIENARKLSTREYSLNAKLGYISLNAALNSDEVLAVAYEYTLNGKTYKVGELSSDGVSAPSTLLVKLLKGTNLTPQLPTWDLMMKNIYSIGAFQVNPEDFILEVLYNDDKTGTTINYLNEGDIKNQILIQVLNLDNLNDQLDPVADGRFDFISGITINPSNGRVIFPVREPFGSYLEKKINDPVASRKYVFNELYDSTKTVASQIAEKNKFIIAGSYKSSSSSEIMLNAMNVPQGSVVVTAGGRQLTENVDYTVDYAAGRVTIINQGLLESGTPVRISLESTSLFAIQTKTLVGTHLDYRISDDFRLGGTIMNLTERPLTQKVNIGDEPISNTIWGLDGSYRTESQFLTTLVDLLPLISTREPSNLTMTGEFAHLIPGHSKAIKKEGTAYIDDFEGSQTSIDMKNFAAWVHSSTPAGRFPEGTLVNDRAYGYNRAKFAFYVIDPLFLRNNSLTPPHIKNNPGSQSSHFVEEVFETDIFPNKENPSGVPTNISVLNLAFYPQERGLYNYSPDVDANGNLLNPQQRWGGIMREIMTNDFETSNVEFIEFWMMDPFVEDPDHGGGELFFNLGDISEDILRDSRKAFENGLPANEDITLVDTSVWGRVPLVQSLVNAFNNDPGSRQFQDVGLDGLNDVEERNFFSDFLDTISTLHGSNSQAYQLAEADPSQDNYNYFRGSNFDQAELSILDRYRNYNNHQGNSPTSEQSTEAYPTTGSTLPDVEDINRDNTLNEKETYYEYRVSIKPNALNVGQNFITDRVTKTSDFPDGTKSSVNWYQFRIPINAWENKIGPIQDFKSIRFLRMYMTGFERPVIIRFAKLDLVRGEWRRYQFPLSQGGEDLSSPEPSESIMDVSAVNIEENAGKTPVNYVLPPGIDRVIDPTNPQLRQLNEQSLLMKVQDLDDGDAKAVYKNIYLDIRQYRKLKMEVHAEALENCNILNDDDLVAFLRVGSDYKDNYYEYEVSLKVTEPGRYNNDLYDDRLIVWPAENHFEIPLEIFQDVKQARNDQMRMIASSVGYNTVFSILDGKGNKVSVKGNPNLSNVRTIMLGIRNPKAGDKPGEDDGMPKCGEIWLNELRLTDFNQDGGWAANARMTAKLADLGTVTVAGNTSTPGFGSIEKKVNERSKEEIIQYDISSNLELGKFFPEKSGVTIPVFIGFSESRINPQYNPLDPDIPLKSALRNAETKGERDTIKHISQDYTKRKSLNFTNVRKQKLQGTPRFYDLANFSLSYAFSETFARNINTEYDIQQRQRGALNYNFNTRPKNVQPFAKANIFTSPSLRLLKDFNFYFYPSRFSFRTDLNRNYGEKKIRNLSNPGLKLDTIVNKNFIWNRYYDLKFDLTRALKLDYSATNTSRVDEPYGVFRKDQSDYEQKRDSLLREIMTFGRNTHYTHNINASYAVPINKIPLLNWITLNARYGATYAWDVGPLTADTIDLGNTIKNSNNFQLNGQLNMINLYNKVPYLKDVNQKFRNGFRQSSGDTRTKEVNYTQEGITLRAGRSRSISHNLKTEQVSATFYDETGQEIEGELEIVSENRITFISEQDYRRVRVDVVGTVEKGENPLIIIADYTSRLMMSIRNISVSYNQSNGSMLPGYKPSTNLIGMQEYSGTLAPGWPFILGWQDENFPIQAISNGWISRDPMINSPFIMNHSNTFNIRSTVEPLPGLRIDLTANRNYTENLNEYYIADINGNFPDSTRSRQQTGNFSMSYITLGTAFEKIYSDENFASETFNKFKDEYRLIISRRLANDRFQGGDYSMIPNDSTGYYDGYGPNSQAVVIPAFLAAYGNRDVNRIGLSALPGIREILPNWRVTFDGLSKIEFFKKYFRSINMNHSYRSSYNVGSFITNPFYAVNNDGFVDLRAIDMNYNFLNEQDIASVSINEQFSPLLSFDMNWINSLTTRLELKKSRSLALSLANNQLTEISSKEIVVGAGYRFNEVPLIFNLPGGNQTSMTSDLNVRADFSIRDNRTIIRKLEEDVDQITAGQRVLKINFNLDYVLSDRFNLRLFFDRIVNKPFVSLSYPTANTNVGFSVRFTLAQ